MAKNPRLIDLTGRQFGEWTVSHQSGNDVRGGSLWHCICTCGKQRSSVIGADLRKGKSLSCGHDRPATTRKKRLRHGESKTRLYHVWKNMRSRCNLSNCENPGWKNYAGRSISVCEEWSLYESFRDWATSNGYKPGLSIERIDVNGNYQPSNCTWADAQTQNVNRRFVWKNENGEAWSQIAKRNGIAVTLFQGRVHDGWSLEDASSIPKQVKWSRQPKR